MNTMLAMAVARLTAQYRRTSGMRRLRAPVRTGAAALAAVISAPLFGLQAPPDQPASRQASPIALPTNVILPASLQLQRWDTLGSGVSGIPTVVVSINDSRLEHAVIATGLDANVVSPDAAVRLKLPPVDGKVRIDALNATSAGTQAEIAMFRASTLELAKVAVAVADVPKMISDHPHPDAPAAWLGAPFLTAFQLSLDPVARTLTLEKPPVKFKAPKGSSVVKIQMRDGRPYAQMSIPGAKSFWALIDTSCPATLIPGDVVDKLKIKPQRTESFTSPDAKQGKGALILLPKLSIGKAEWLKARVTYLTADSGKEVDRTFAVVGMDYLNQFKVTMDFTHLQMALTPLARPEDGPPPAAQPTPKPQRGGQRGSPTFPPVNTPPKTYP